MTEIPNPWDAERLDCGSQVIAVSGAIGFEQVEYPTRKFEPTLGGSGLYAAIASAFYGQTRLIGTVGTDASFTAFRTNLRETLNTEYVNIVPGTSFRWRARYLDCDAPPTTLSTSLGVLRHSRAAPIIRDSKVLLCSNEDPAFQHTLVAS